MLRNGWINPMHTRVPGPDGRHSYGGACFPKDTRAFVEHMRRRGTPHAVLQATIDERDAMRSDDAPNGAAASGAAGTGRE